MPVANAFIYSENAFKHEKGRGGVWKQMTRDHMGGSDVKVFDRKWRSKWMTESDLTGNGNQGSRVSDAPSPGVDIARLAGCAAIGPE